MPEEDLTSRPDTFDASAVVEDVAAKVEAERLGLGPGDEFSVVTLLSDHPHELTEDEFSRLTDEIGRRVTTFGVMLEAMHDVKCDFVVFRGQ
ncbi:hypothetical protein OG496_10730 [Streptomyces sp. NBC_00988]|uniref:hypothetical protein n=1 Tax=Streptomyces sp. NBC_00988 TaxID=2903704 RepID=UPI0038700839|nr:hypothetical protein OG496_10730 [Streptomyces sp. NBC_00988]